MIEYIKLFWEGAPDGEPAVILYEVDTENVKCYTNVVTVVANKI